MSKRVVIFAGGTGGHVFPALAVARQLREKGYQVSWVGTEHRIEARVVPDAGFEFHAMVQQGLRGRGIVGYLKAPFLLSRAVWQARRLLKQLGADLVIGFGGYTAGPGGLAAKLLGVPLLIHEQNAVPGLTNKLLAKIANRSLLGFEIARKNLPSAEWVGNPVRDEVFALSRNVERAQQSIRILVVGGSLGARVLNERVPQTLSSWRGDAIRVTHQAGQGNRDHTLQAYQQCPPAVEIEVLEFIDDMAAAYASHDLIICRSGALTVAEVAAAGIASVLVPFPYAVDDHQTRNAEVLVMQHAAVLMPQTKMTAEHLLATLEELIAVPAKLRQMGEHARKVAQPDATTRIVRHCQQLMKEQVVV